MTIAIVAVVITPQLGFAQPSTPSIERLDLNRPATKFLTGRKINLGNRAAVSVDWTGISLRTRVTQFSQARKVAIFLDRRVDSQANQAFSMKDASAEQVIWKLAESNAIGACRVGNWYYLGPTDVAASLPNLIDDLKQETRRNRERYKVAWNRSSSLKTPAIFEPKQWLVQCAQDNQFEVTNLDVLPHDLWLGVDLPSMSLEEKIQLVLIGFGLTFQRNKTGESIRLIKWEPPETVIREVDIPSAIPSSQYENFVRQVQQGVADVAVKRKGKRLILSGTASSVLSAEARVITRQAVVGSSGTTANVAQTNQPAQEVFTLSVTAARGAILTTIAKQTSRELVYPQELRAQLQTSVTIDVKNATPAEIVTATLKGSTLAAEITASQIRISSK